MTHAADVASIPRAREYDESYVRQSETRVPLLERLIFRIASARAGQARRGNPHPGAMPGRHAAMTLKFRTAMNAARVLLAVRSLPA